MNSIEFISKDGINFDLYINGVKQEQIYELVIRAEVGDAVRIELSRYGLKR